MNNIIVSILAYNSEPFIRSCISSIYDFADKIVIVEGTYGIQRAYGPRSTDRTVEQIKNFPDPAKKIVLIQMNGKEHDHRNAVLAYCDPGDWFFTVHTDEIYKADDLKRLKKILLEDKETDVFSIVWYNFYFNFKLYLEEVSPPRIYRIKEGCRFDHKDTLVTKEGVDYMKLKAKVIDKKDLTMYHYGYIYEIREKMRYYGKAGETWYNEIFRKFSPGNADDIYEKNRVLSGERGIHLQGGGILKEFTGEHPQSIKSSPLFGRDLIAEFKKGYTENVPADNGFIGGMILMLKKYYYKRLGN